MAEEGGSGPTIIKAGGSNVGLIIGGVAVIAIAGFGIFYVWTGYEKQRNLLNVVQQWKDCLDEQIDNGATLEEAHAYCDPIYEPTINTLIDDLQHSFGWFVGDTLTKIGLIIGFTAALRYLAYPAIKWAYDSWSLKHRGGGGGTPGNEYHDYNNGTNHPTQEYFEDACLVSYGTPNYTHQDWPYLWANINALPAENKQMLGGYFYSQGVPDAFTSLNQAWSSLPTEQQMLIAGLIIAGTLLVCTVSLGTAAPVMLPIAASAIAMV